MRMKCIVQYDGNLFQGYQRQTRGRTVQGEIESALETIHHGFVQTIGAGRTDASVHAYGQVFHFETNLSIDCERWKLAFNSILPKDIHIKSVELVDETFHARYSVKQKEYRYYLSIGEFNPLKRQHTGYFPYPIDVSRMKEAIPLFIGEHDFTSFQSGNAIKHRVRRIQEASIEEEENLLIFTFKGNGFLRYQVRIMVGTLIEIGANRRSKEQLIQALELKDRKYAGFTAEPQGLYLMNIYY